jgi:HAD superfamily hydrolase (TIGR01509 family)
MADSPRHGFELVIFDCDGVLVDSELVSNQILVIMLAELGIRLTVKEAAAHFTGYSNEDCVQLIGQMLDRPAPETFLDDFLRRELAALAQSVRPIPGVMDVLPEIAIPMCVASSGLPEKIATTLVVTGLLPFFGDRTFSTVMVAHPKPAPDIYLYAAERMGVAPGRSAVIEDSPVGVRAGVAAGMTVFGYAANTDATSLAAAGAQVFREMGDLPLLLRQMKTE